MKEQVMYILMIFITTLGVVVMSLFCCYFLKSKRKWLHVLLAAIVSPILLVTLDLTGTADITVGHPIRTFVAAGAFVLSAILIFEDSLAKKLLFCGLSNLIQNVVCSILIPFFILSGYVQWDLDHTDLTPHFMIAQVVICSCFILLTYGTAKFIKKMEPWMNRDGMKLIALFLIVQVALLLGLAFKYTIEVTFGTVFEWLLLTSFCVCSDIAIFYILKGIEQKCRLEEQSTFFQNQLAIQLSLYEHFSDFSQMLDQTRLHLVKQLERTCNSLENGHYKKASQLMQALPHDIKELKPAVYCAHSILNALLFIKHQEMKQLNIQFTYMLSIDEGCFVEKSDLCRIVSNLLDNGLEAWRYTPRKDLYYIKLTCMPIRQTLVITAENPFYGDLNLKKDGLPISCKKEPGHGNGLAIIKSLVERYDGTLRIHTNQDSQTFVATIILNNN